MKKKLLIGLLALVTLTVSFSTQVYGASDGEEDEARFVSIGTYSILNNDLNTIDYKSDANKQIELMNSYFLSDCKNVNKITSGLKEQDFQDIGDNKYLAYLIENNYISRRIKLTSGQGLAAYSCEEIKTSANDHKKKMEQSITQGESLMSKSDLYMALYKICYGVEVSNPIAFRYALAPSVPTKSESCKIAENTYAYYPNGGVAYYQSPNVYELYLTKLLEKGLISMRELNLPITSEDGGKDENSFQDVYNVIQKGRGGPPGANFVPNWYNYSLQPTWDELLDTDKSSLYALEVPADGSGVEGRSLYRKYLGNSITVSNYGNPNGFIVENYVTVDKTTGSADEVSYFAKEKLTVGEALEIIEKMLRASEKEMTRIEAELINYKYGVNVLETMTDEERNTVSFLIAKGVLNFDEKDANCDRELYTDLSANFRWEDSWKLLYRVANKEARYDFSKLQLTDAESFWQKKGYAENEIEVYKTDAVPYMEVISATKKDADNKCVKSDELIGSSDYLPYEEPDDSSDPDDNLISRLFDKFATKLHATGTGTTVSGATNSYYEVEILLANQCDNINVEYYYGEDKLNPTDYSSIEEVTGANTSDYPGYTKYTFKIMSTTRNRAISKIHTKLKVGNMEKSVGSMMGVTTMKSNETGETTTLISKDAITELLPEIKSINNNTLMNTETGVMVTMLPNQENLGGRSIAFCGNKVIICDDMIVTDNSSQIYYNLEVICSILSNGMLKKLNGSYALVRNSISNEMLYQVVDSDDNAIENNYVAEFKNFYTDKSGSDLELFYNLDSATRTKNCLTRTWDVVASDKDGKDQNVKITVIVEWNFCVPTLGANGSTLLLLEDCHEDFTLEDVNTFLNTRPADKALAHFWDRNLEMSNALARMMYSDEKGTDYITCGYLVPSVYILSTGGAGLNKKIGSDKDSVLLTKDALSENQLMQFFKKLHLPDSYKTKYLQSNDQWWNYYYKEFTCAKKDPKTCKGDNCENYYVHKLMSEENCFKMYTPTIISDNGNVLYVFGANKQGTGSGYYNTRFIVAEGNTIYRSVSKDNKCSLSNKADLNNYGVLKMDTKTDNRMMVPNKGDQVLLKDTNGKQVALRYLSTEQLAGRYVYRFVLSDGSGSGISNTFPCHFDLSSAGGSNVANGTITPTSKSPTYSASDLFRYKDKNNKTLNDNAKDVASILGTHHTSSIPAHYYSWEKDYYTQWNGMKYVASWTYKRGNSGGGYTYKGEIRELDPNFAQNGKSSLLGVASFNKVSIQDEIHTAVPVIVLSNDYYIGRGSGGSYELIKGTGLNVLNSTIYYVGLNGIIRDKLLAQQDDLIPISKLKEKNTIYINNKQFKVGKDGWLNSTMQIAQTSVATEIAKQFAQSGSAKSQGVQSAILQTFNGYGIHTGGRVYSFATFVKDVKLLGKTGNTESGMLTRQLYMKGKKMYCQLEGGNSIEVTKNSINKCSPTAYSFSIKPDDNLLCRSISESGNVYELVQVTDAYADSGMGKLPFVLLDALDAEESKVELSFSETGFKVTAFTKEIKNRFLEDYQELLTGDVWSMLRLFGIYILGYLMVITWVVTLMLRMPAVHSILLSLSQKDRGAHGLDIVKIITLGVYSVNDNPSISKLVIMDILFTIIMFFILNGFG